MTASERSSIEVFTGVHFAPLLVERNIPASVPAKTFVSLKANVSILGVIPSSFLVQNLPLASLCHCHWKKTLRPSTQLMPAKILDPFTPSALALL